MTAMQTSRGAAKAFEEAARLRIASPCLDLERQRYGRFISNLIKKKQNKTKLAP